MGRASHSGGGAGGGTRCGSHGPPIYMYGVHTRVSLPLTRGKPAISDSTAYWPTPRPTRAVDGAEATAWSLQSEVWAKAASRDAAEIGNDILGPSLQRSRADAHKGRSKDRGCHCRSQWGPQTSPPPRRRFGGSTRWPQPHPRPVWASWPISMPSNRKSRAHRASRAVRHTCPP